MDYIPKRKDVLERVEVCRQQKAEQAKRDVEKYVNVSLARIKDGLQTTQELPVEIQLLKIYRSVWDKAQELIRSRLLTAGWDQVDFIEQRADREYGKIVVIVKLQ